MEKSIEEIVFEVKKINWFSNLGNSQKNETKFQMEFVSSHKEFIKNIDSLNWENTTLEASNDLREYLTKNNVKYRERWNTLVEETKSYFGFIDEICNSFEEEYQQNIKADLEWNILLIVLETYYFQFNKKIPLFFQVLLDVYKNGNIPCGFKFIKDWDFSKGGTLFYY